MMSGYRRGCMRHNKKETMKTILLVFLVISSIALSYLITTYQPDYEIFTRKSWTESYGR